MISAIILPFILSLFHVVAVEGYDENFFSGK